jgi:hypothetical protein
MSEYKKIGFDLVALSEAFNIVKQKKCVHLDAWIAASFTLNDFENKIIDEIHADIADSVEAMNEEELKARLISLLFFVAKIDTPDKIRVFYERSISTHIGEYALSVVTDCLVALPKFSLPTKPYFFLQEFKKAKGEKKDPEAQMLTAMIIANHLNNDSKPVYGGYLIGSNWRFATLVDNNYCISRKFDAENKTDLIQIVYILRQLKELVLNW